MALQGYCFRKKGILIKSGCLKVRMQYIEENRVNPDRYPMSFRIKQCEK